MKIIGVYGTMGSGKSIFCEAFPTAYNEIKGITAGNLHYASMSEFMKTNVAGITGMSLDEKVQFAELYRTCNLPMDYSATAKSTYLRKYEATIGQLLQRYGLAMKQAFGDRYWVDRIIRDIPDGTDVAVIDGIRYKSDVEAIKEAGGDVIKIERLTGGQENESRDSKHIGETELLEYTFDYVMPNQSVWNGSQYSKDKIRAIAVQQMINQIIAKYK